jgi:hypothetical protein
VTAVDTQREFSFNEFIASSFKILSPLKRAFFDLGMDRQPKETIKHILSFVYPDNRAAFCVCKQWRGIMTQLEASNPDVALLRFIYELVLSGYIRGLAFLNGVGQYVSWRFPIEKASFPDGPKFVMCTYEFQQPIVTRTMWGILNDEIYSGTRWTERCPSLFRTRVISDFISFYSTIRRATSHGHPSIIMSRKGINELCVVETCENPICMFMRLNHPVGDDWHMHNHAMLLNGYGRFSFKLAIDIDFRNRIIQYTNALEIKRRAENTSSARNEFHVYLPDL